MSIKLYERRYWDVSAGKVRSVFDMDKDAAIITGLPECDHFMIWLDLEPEELIVDVRAAIIKTHESRGAADPCQHIGVDPLDGFSD